MTRIIQSVGDPRIEVTERDTAGFTSEEMAAIWPFIKTPILLGYCEWKFQRRLHYLRGLLQRFAEWKWFDLSDLAVGSANG